MLVLTRKVGQQVLINDGAILVKVLKADDGLITIGFKAPHDIDIDREEVFVQKKAKQRAALNPNQP